MSGDPLDLGDVQAMIRDERYDVEAMIRDERSAMRGELHDFVSATAAPLLDRIRGLEDDVAVLQRVLDARTEHLV